MGKVHNLKYKKFQRQSLRSNSTIHEIILWPRIKNKKLGYKFRRQQSIGKYIVDFYCTAKRLVVEIDGSQHLNKQKEYDVKRDKYLKNLGFRILRFGNDKINRNIDGVVEEIIFYINKKKNGLIVK